jgi:hypothetical protein
MIQRPAKVPRQARYSMRDGWWQVGEIVDGKPFGPWKTYRPDGSPLFEARFDSKGRLQGAYRRFHPDGSLARDARYKRGAAVEITMYRARGTTDDVFPTSDPRVWQVSIDFDDDGKEIERTPRDERGNSLLEDRTEAATHALGVLDPVFAGAKPDDFLASGLLPRILSTFDAAPPVPVDHFLLPRKEQPRRHLDAKRYQDLYGSPMPAALRAWNDAFAGQPALLGMRITRDADLVAEGNLIEALIAEHQAAPCRSDGLYALASGLIPIGTSTDGRLRYCAAVGEAAFAPTDAVYPFDLSQEAFQMPVARSLDDFAYALALVTAADRKSVSKPCLEQAYERLRGRIDLRAPMTGVEEQALDEDTRGDDEVTGDPQGDHAEGFFFRRAGSIPGYCFHRSRWLLRLLAGNAEGAAAVFDPSYSALDDDRLERTLKNLNQPWVALYWAFHCFVFQDPRLEKLLAVCSDVPSQLSRDVAALVRELAGGRTKLGLVENFGDTLDKFRALDPMSNKPDSEEEEEEQDDDEDSEEVEAPTSKLSVPPALADAGAVLEWALAEGYSRENLLLRHELEAAALGLSLRADPAIVPVIAGMFDDHPWLGWELLLPWLEGDRADLAALAPKARDWLRDRGDGAVYRWMAGAGVLARAGKPGDAKLIAEVLEPSLDQMFGRGFGFEAAMGLSVLEDAIVLLCRAVTKLGISETVIAALEGVANADTHLVDDIRGPCALALASVKRGLDAVIEGVRGQIARDQRPRITDGQLHALGILGLAEPERRAEIVELLRSLESILGDELGFECAMFDLGQGGDLTAIVSKHLEPGKLDDEDSLAKRRIRVLDTLARRTDVPAELAQPFVGSQVIALHLAAVRALRARGAPVPGEIELFDPYLVGQLASKSRDELHTALAAGRGTFLGNIALWLGEHPDPSSREPLAAFARALAAKRVPKDGQGYYDLRWTIAAIVRTGGGEAAIDELLRHDNEIVSNLAVEYADNLGPAIARGMVAAFMRDDKKPVRRWLTKYKNDPRIAAALVEHGLAIEDLSKKKED